QVRGRLAVDAIASITFDSVSFEYSSGVPTIRNLSFSIVAGEAIGVVGPSGAGKSTLVQLILRLRDPSSGAYTVSGVAARDIDDDVWHRKVAYLPQEPH